MTAVELAAIDEAAIAIEQEEIRRARRIVCTRYELRLVVQVREEEVLSRASFAISLGESAGYLMASLELIATTARPRGRTRG